MKRIWGFVGIFFLASTLSAKNQEADLATVLGPLKASSGVESLDRAKLLDLLTFGYRRGYNLFDLLCETGSYLKTKSVRLVIDGSDLRWAAMTYRLGDHRVDTLLPLAKVIRIAFGSALGNDSELEVILSSTHSGFLELGDFLLEKRYGFREIATKSLTGAYGVTVKNGIFSWELDRIERVQDPTGGVNPNFIGISLRLFPRAKRWHIDPIRPLKDPA